MTKEHNIFINQQCWVSLALSNNAIKSANNGQGEPFP